MSTSIPYDVYISELFVLVSKDNLFVELFYILIFLPFLFVFDNDLLIFVQDENKLEVYI